MIFVLIKNNALGEPSKLKSDETWEMFPSGDDPLSPYPTWDFLNLEQISETS